MVRGKKLDALDAANQNPAEQAPVKQNPAKQTATKQNVTKQSAATMLEAKKHQDKQIESRLQAHAEEQADMLERRLEEAAVKKILNSRTPRKEDFDRDAEGDLDEDYIPEPIPRNVFNRFPAGPGPTETNTSPNKNMPLGKPYAPYEMPNAAIPRGWPFLSGRIVSNEGGPILFQYLLKTNFDVKTAIETWLRCHPLKERYLLGGNLSLLLHHISNVTDLRQAWYDKIRGTNLDIQGAKAEKSSFSLTYKMLADLIPSKGISGVELKKNPLVCYTPDIDAMVHRICNVDKFGNLYTLKPDLEKRDLEEPRILNWSIFLRDDIHDLPMLHKTMLRNFAVIEHELNVIHNARVDLNPGQGYMRYKASGSSLSSGPKLLIRNKDIDRSLLQRCEELQKMKEELFSMSSAIPQRKLSDIYGVALSDIWKEGCQQFIREVTAIVRMSPSTISYEDFREKLGHILARSDLDSPLIMACRMMSREALFRYFAYQRNHNNWEEQLKWMKKTFGHNPDHPQILECKAGEPMPFDSFSLVKWDIS